MRLEAVAELGTSSVPFRSVVDITSHRGVSVVGVAHENANGRAACGASAVVGAMSPRARHSVGDASARMGGDASHLTAAVVV